MMPTSSQTTEKLPNLTHFMLTIVSHNRWIISGFICISGLWAIEQALSPFLIKGMIDGITQRQGQHMLSSCSPYFCAYLITSILHNLSLRVHNELTLHITPKIRDIIITQLYQHTLHCPSHMIQALKTSCLSKKTQDVTQQAEKILSITTDFLIPRLCTLISVNLMLYQNLSGIFCTILCAWTCLFLTSTLLATKYLTQKTHTVSQGQDNLYQHMADTLKHHRLIENHHHWQQELHHTETLQHGLSLHEKKLMRCKMFIYFMQSSSITILMGSLLYTLMYTLPLGQVTAGQLTLMLSLANAFVSATHHISHGILQITQAIEMGTHALSSFPSYQKKNKTLSPNLTKHQLEITKLSFGYKENNPIFRNLQHVIPAGHKISIQGPSGSGKSTLVRLIAGKNTPLSGKITLQGYDLKHLSEKKLTEMVSFLDKSPDILNRSIFENLRIAKPNATTVELLNACRLAKCDTFIQQLEKKMETILGQGGRILSAGQAQRLALARVFLKPTPVIILDEATCHIDTTIEQQILNNLVNHTPHSSLIIVAHHLCPQLPVHDVWTLQDCNWQSERSQYKTWDHKYSMSVQKEATNATALQ